MVRLLGAKVVIAGIQPEISRKSLFPWFNWD